MLAHRLLVLLIEFGILVLDDLAHANLRQFLGHQLLVKEAAFDGGLVLNEGGNHLVQILAADARRFLALGFSQSFDLDLELSCFLVEADIALVGIVTAFAVVEAWSRTAVSDSSA